MVTSERLELTHSYYTIYLIRRIAERNFFFFFFFFFLQANVLNNKNVLESIHVYNLKPIGYVSTFRFPVCSFISCLYDLCNVECTNSACPRVPIVRIFVTEMCPKKCGEKKEEKKRLAERLNLEMSPTRFTMAALQLPSSPTALCSCMRLSNRVTVA